MYRKTLLLICPILDIGFPSKFKFLKFDLKFELYVLILILMIFNNQNIFLKYIFSPELKFHKREDRTYFCLESTSRQNSISLLQTQAFITSDFVFSFL